MTGRPGKTRRLTPPARPLPSASRYVTRLKQIGWVAIFAVTSLTIVAFFLLRHHQLEERRQSLTALARMIGDHSERSFLLADRVAQSVKRRLEDAPARSALAPDPALFDFARDHSDGIVAVALVDGGGRVMAERHFAPVPRDSRDIVLHYGFATPAVPAAAELRVALSRGAAEAYYARIARQAGCSIALVDAKGGTLAAYPSSRAGRGSGGLAVREPLSRNGWSILVQCSRAEALFGWRIVMVGLAVAVLLLDLSILALIWLGSRQMLAAQSSAAVAAQQARTDLLTGLPNRLAFQETVRRAIAQAQHEGHTVAIIMLDLDGFKDINDSLGHAAGDLLLKLAAARMRHQLRADDFLARLGGDEFAVIQSAVTHKDETMALARHLRKAFDQPFDLDGGEARLSASMGAALALRDGRDIPDLLEKADLALYASKAERLGRLLFYEAQMSQAAALRAQLQTELANALEAGELALFYQPILDLDRQRISGCEALMRWRHPTRGLVSPDQFIPILEANGWILQAGELALWTACREAVDWPAHMTVAVNLSPIQCHDPALPDLVARVLATSGLPAPRLELEITETTSLDPERGAFDILHKLRAMGVRIVLDDFGTGFASLARLSSFPFDKLKIDKTFVDRLRSSDQGRAVVRSTIELSRRLGMPATAEGVETDEQFDLLQKMRCAQIQGYLVSPPLEADDLGGWLAREPWRALRVEQAA